MLRAIGLPLMCLAMFSIAGGHWAVLQTVAWAQMVVEYSKNATVAEVVEKTFSGNAPCAMCKKIAEGRQKERQAPATLKTDKKAESFTEPVCARLLPPPARDYFYPPADHLVGPVRIEGPPRPVPRTVFLIVA